MENISTLDAHSIWHPFTPVPPLHAPIPIAKGKGIYLYTPDGTRYIDAISSWWVNLHGHTHPYIVEQLKRQLDELEHVIFAGFTHFPATQLASRLLSILPGTMSKIFYSDNGSTAVETALKMAIQYWHNQGTPKAKVICFKGSYHGDTFGSMSAAGKNNFNLPFWKHLFEVHVIDPPHKGPAFEQLQEILNANNDVACFIFEPLVLAAGGMMIYPARQLDPLLNLCRAQGVLTIADEVMTGFGRTGPLFACEMLQEKPDLICLSKGLTGGFLPLGATACTQSVFQTFSRSTFLHGHSYTGNPLACRAALASLDLLLDPACTEQRSRIAKNHHQFCTKWQNHPKLKRCETLGTLLAIEYNSEHISYLGPLQNQLYTYFLSKKIIMRPLGNVVYVLPPYCIQEDELQLIYQHIIGTFQ